MAISLVDTAVPMNDTGYPVARAKHIWLDNDISLQKAIDDGLISGDTSSVLTEAEFLALPEEERLNNSYYLYDIGVHYKNGIAYSRKEPISLTMAEYKALEEVDPDQEYLVEADAEGILLGAEDIGYNNAESGLEATTVQGAIDNNSGRIATLETGVATKQENIFKKHIFLRKGDASDTKLYCLIATLKTSNLAFVNEPVIIEGVMGNATSSTQKMLFKVSFDFRDGAKETAKVIYGYVNQPSLFSHVDLLTTFDESTEIAYIYVHHKTNYSIIDADISVPQRNAELYLTIPETFEKTDTIIGTEVHRMSTSTGVKVLAGLDDTTSSTESTWSSSKIASEINPTIDRTDLFPSNELDLNLLYNRCGTGVYDIVGQGSSGHGMIRADLWAINNGTICYIVSIMYSDGSSSTVGGNINAQPTVPINSKWMSVINKLTKIGYL